MYTNIEYQQPIGNTSSQQGIPIGSYLDYYWAEWLLINRFSWAEWLLIPSSAGKIRRPDSKHLQLVLRTSENKFVDFLEGCLKFPPKDHTQRQYNTSIWGPIYYPI